MTGKHWLLLIGVVLLAGVMYVGVIGPAMRDRAFATALKAELDTTLPGADTAVVRRVATDMGLSCAEPMTNAGSLGGVTVTSWEQACQASSPNVRVRLWGPDAEHLHMIQGSGIYSYRETFTLFEKLAAAGSGTTADEGRVQRWFEACTSNAVSRLTLGDPDTMFGNVAHVGNAAILATLRLNYVGVAIRPYRPDLRANDPSGNDWGVQGFTYVPVACPAP